MKNFPRFAWHVLRFVLALSAALLLLLLATLYAYDVRVPDAWLRGICERISGGDFAVRADSARFNLSRGLRLEGVRLLERGRPAPVAKADSVEARLSLYRLPWRVSHAVRRLRVTGLRYPRLPESYYIPNSQLHPGEPDYVERDAPVELNIPQVHAFKLELRDPQILGVHPKEVEVASCSASPKGLFLRGATVRWPDGDAPMQVTGSAELDLERQQVRTTFAGQARQHHIRPLLEALDVPSALPYIDGFTSVYAPVDASCAIVVDLRRNDFHIALDLSPRSGAYNGVPFTSASGHLEIGNSVRGTNFNYRVVARDLAATFPGGGHAHGNVEVESTNAVTVLRFDAAAHGLSVSNMLALADVLNDGTMDCLQADRGNLEIAGSISPYHDHPEFDDIRCRFDFPRATFFGAPLLEAGGAFHQIGCSVTYTNVSARTANGGAVTGSASMEFPGYSEERAAFSLSLAGRGIPLQDIADALGVETRERTGTVDGTLTLDGPIATNLVSRLNGRGRFTSRNGHLSRLNLFMGFTAWLSDNVPGVAQLVDQSQASASITITNGVIRTGDLVVEGSVFAIRGGGSYDMAADRLDGRVHARFFKKDSLIGIITQPFTSPLTKALLEFDIGGTMESPTWSYITPLDRITGGKKGPAQ